MKTKITKTIGAMIIALFGMSNIVLAQKWRLGGNPPPQLDATNNILGTNANLPLRIFTNSTEYMRITETGA